MIKQSDIIEKEVFSEDGESLGFIKDILIDASRGKVIGFIISQGLFDDLNLGRNVLPINENIVFKKDNIIINTLLKDDYDKNREKYKKLLELL